MQYNFYLNQYPGTYYAHCRSVYDCLLTQYNSAHESETRALFRSSGNENAFAIFTKVAKMRDQLTNQEVCENSSLENLSPFDSYSDPFTEWIEITRAAKYGEDDHFLKLLQIFFTRCEKTDAKLTGRRETISIFSKALQKLDDDGNSLLHIAIRGGCKPLLNNEGLFRQVFID